jgi:hypothetical protein
MQKLKINKLFKILFVMLAVLSFTASDGQQIFQKEYYGGSIWQNIIENNNGYFFAGHNLKLGVNSHQIYIYHIDHSGDIIWAKHLGNSSPTGEFIYDYAFNHDSTEILFVGSRGHGSSSYQNILIFKTDVNGNLLWHKILADSLNSAATTIYRDNNYYYVGGRVYADLINNFTGGLGFCLKLNEVGDILNEFYYTTQSNDPVQINGIVRVDENLYLSGSIFNSTYLSETDILLIKADTLGNIIFSKKFDSSSEEYARSIEKDYSDDLIITGTTHGYIYPTQFQIRVNNNGDVVYSKIIDAGSSSGSFRVKNSSDFGYLFTMAPAIILKTDSLFNVNWSSRFEPGFLFKSLNFAKETLDGGIIAGGSINNDFNSLIVKIDSNLQGGCNQFHQTVMSYNFSFNEDSLYIIKLNLSLIEIIDSLSIYNISNLPITYCQTGTSMSELSNKKFDAYPNPYKNIIYINTSHGGSVKGISLINTIGTLTKIPYIIINENLIVVLEDQLPAGFYILQIEGENGEIKNLKIVKE